MDSWTESELGGTLNQQIYFSCRHFMRFLVLYFLEAFAYGAVPIALDTFGVNNIITHDTNGYVVGYENKFHRDNYQFIDHYNDNIQQLISGMSEVQETKIIADIVTHLS
jgi:hypothetical protein